MANRNRKRNGSADGASSHKRRLDPRAIGAFVASLALAGLAWLRFRRQRREPPPIQVGRRPRKGRLNPGSIAEPDIASGEWQPPYVDFQEQPDHERRDVRVGCVVAAGLAFLLVMGGVLAVTSWIQASYLGSGPSLQPPPPLLTSTPAVYLPPQPRPMEVAGGQLQVLRAREAATLNSYGWADRGTGVVRIPIDRAIDLLTQRGLPVRPQETTTQLRDRGQELPVDSSSGRTTERIWP